MSLRLRPIHPLPGWRFAGSFRPLCATPRRPRGHETDTFRGTYQGHAPAADAAKRVFTLNLASDGTAILTTLYIGKDNVTMHGRWTQSGSQIVLTFDSMGPNRTSPPITFRHRDHELSPIHWDPNEWGRAGPPVLHRRPRRARRLLTMGVFYNIMLGYFFGFALGVGCALAVFYAIYSGGYRKAVEHSLQQQKPKRYLRRWLPR